MRVSNADCLVKFRQNKKYFRSLINHHPENPYQSANFRYHFHRFEYSHVSGGVFLVFCILRVGFAWSLACLMIKGHSGQPVVLT